MSTIFYFTKGANKEIFQILLLSQQIIQINAKIQIKTLYTLE